MGYVLGVDLGTTYSAAATTRGNDADRFPLGNRTPTIPSVVCLRDDGEVLVGEAAERRALTEPGRTAREFKRRLGDPTPLILGGTPYGAETLSAHLLRWIVAKVTEQHGEAPDAIVLSHPANWGPYKLELLTQTVQAADVGPVSFITEPEAAAVHYAQQERLEAGQAVAVYDFGGGTFDAAVLRKTAEGFELVGQPEGLERIGGIDFDQAVFAHVDQAIGGAISELDPADTSAMAAVHRLREECQLAKEQLSQDTDVDIPVLLPGVQTEVRLTRAEFEAMIRPRIAETISSLERAIRSAGMTPADITKILLVGGSSRIPLVGQMVREATNRPIAIDAHPKFAIAIGAALIGAAGVARPADEEAAVAAIVAPDPEPTPAPEPEPSAPEPEPEPTPVTTAPAAPPAPAASPAPPKAATPKAATPPGAPASGGGRPGWMYGAAAAVVVLVVAAATQFLGGDDGEPATAETDPTAQVTETSPSPSETGPNPETADASIGAISILEDGTVEVAFTTVDFQPDDPGYSVEIGWTDDYSQPIESRPYVTYRGESPFTGFTALDRPAAAVRICMQVVTPEGAKGVFADDHCATLDAAALADATRPDGRFVELLQLRDNGSRYLLDYSTRNFPVASGATWHIHAFWFPTYTEDNVGVGLGGSWVLWQAGGLWPGDSGTIDNAGFDLANRPADATHLCVVVAEADHSILLQADQTGYPSGNCLPLPDES